MNIYELIDKMALEHKSIFDMPLRVTFYARVSTHSDEQLNSQENQIQTFTDLINKKMLPIGVLSFKRYIAPYLKGEPKVEFTYQVNVQM